MQQVLFRKVFITLIYTLLIAPGPILLTIYFTKTCSNEDEECKKTKKNVLIAGIVCTIVLLSIVSIFV